MIRAILFAQAADLLTMLLMVKAYGKRTEANPVARGLLTGGPMAPTLAKFSAVALALGIAAVAGGRVRTGLQLVVVSIGIVGAVTNVVTIRALVRFEGPLAGARRRELRGPRRPSARRRIVGAT